MKTIKGSFDLDYGDYKFKLFITDSLGKITSISLQ